MTSTKSTLDDTVDLASEAALSDTEIPENEEIDDSILNKDDHGDIIGEINGEIDNINSEMNGHRNSRSPSTDSSRSGSRSSSSSSSQSDSSSSSSGSRSSSATPADDLPERMKTVNIEESQQGKVTRAKRAKTPSKEARQEAKRQKVEALLEDLQGDFQKLKAKTTAIEKENIEHMN